MHNPEILNRIIGAEDAARRVRNEIDKQIRGRDVVNLRDQYLRDLADSMAQGLQAVREALQNV